MSIAVAATTVPASNISSSEKDLTTILAELERNPPGEEAIANAQRIIADVTTEKSFRERTLDEINNLSKTVLQIENDFTILTNSISDFDSKQAIKDKNSGHPIKFLSEWKSYHESYTSLLFNSQTTATQLKAKIEDLLMNLIPLINDQSVSLVDKRAELAGFIEDLDEFQTKGTDKAREFLRLREDIKNFRLNLIKQVAQQKKEVKEKVDSITADIVRLEAELQASSGFFSACWSALKITVPTTAGAVSTSAGAIAGITALAPVAGTVLLVAGLGALGYSVSKGLNERLQTREAKESQITRLKLERSALHIRQKNLQEMSSQLVLLCSNFQGIFDRLGIMQQIWTMIKSDAVGLQEAMHQLQNARTIAGFNSRVKNVEKLWHTLAWALDNYALGVATV